MTIRLDGLLRWKQVIPGDQLKLPAERPDDARRVRLHVNCEDRTWIYCDHIDAAHAQFLACVPPGPEIIEFYARGDLLITFAPESMEDRPSQVWVQTAELEPNVSKAVDAVSFTEIVQRRARNPELEYVQAMARYNQRLMESQLAAQAAQISELGQLVKGATTNVNSGTPSGGNTGEQPGPGADGGDGGTGSGGDGK